MAKKLWGGRFSKKTDPLVEEFTKSIDYDYKLAEYDVVGSLIHVQILKKGGYLTSPEADTLTKALRKIHKDIKEGRLKYDRKTEDIHTNIQNLLERGVGDLVLKLHTARSRNEQVVFDLKCFCITEVSYIDKLCQKLIESLVKISVKNRDIIIPGYTHLQHAQFVKLPDYLNSFSHMFSRDMMRLKFIKDNIRPFLGAGALAGTPISAVIYNDKTVRRILKSAFGEVHFSGAVRNSLDAVSDRDFVVEILSALAILGMHLSRLGEDLIIWSTKEFGFIEIDEAFATGSSLMPQKKNPDVLELIRGYTGTLYGNLVSVLTMMKGLPLTYNRDMQLDKPPLFNSFEIVIKELKVLEKLIATLKWDKAAIKKCIDDDETLYATDLVYYLIDKGEPFKKAHDIIGKLVKHSIESERRIRDMENGELRRFSAKLKHNEIVKLMHPSVSVKSRISINRSKGKN